MRMAAKTRRQQIMAAATQLFSRQGFDGTTTRAIARLAGVNEAIIFRHFTSKEELYQAVLAEQVQERDSAEGLRRKLRSWRDVRRTLSEVAENLLTRNEQDAATTRLLLFSALRPDEPSKDIFRSYIMEPLNLVSEYIRKGVEGGALRKIDPVIAARAFLGMVIYHNLLQELLGGAGHQKYNSRELGQQLANIWLNGVSVRQGEAAEGRSHASGKREARMAGNGRGGGSQPAPNHAVTA